MSCDLMLLLPVNPGVKCKVVSAIHGSSLVSMFRGMGLESARGAWGRGMMPGGEWKISVHHGVCFFFFFVGEVVLGQFTAIPEM